MRMRQGKRAGVLQGILGGNHKKRLLQGPGFALYGDLLLFHGFQQRALGLGRGPIDLICQEHLSKHRTGVEMKRAGILVKNGNPQNIAGQHVTGKLNPLKIEIQAFGQHLGHSGFADTRQIFNQKVAFGKQAGQGQPDLGLFSQQHAADLPDDGFKLILHHVYEISPRYNLPFSMSMADRRDKDLFQYRIKYSQ